MKAIHDRVHEALASREDELVTLHRLLVSIPTVNWGDAPPPGAGPNGNESALARAAADYLKAVGVETSLAAAEDGRANLLAWTGHGARGMLWMSHGDVVPVGDETAWTHPPFGGAVADGRIWGRGSNDCKMLAACQLFAMACLARLGLPRRGRLRLAVGADEETGGKLGFGWLVRERVDFCRTDLAICEGGGAAIGRDADGTPAIAVGTGEKGRYEVTFRTHAPGGHASGPWGKANPVTQLAELVRRLEAWRPAVRVEAPIFEHIVSWGGVDRISKNNLKEFIDRIGERSPSLANSLMGQSRMTITPTVIHAGDKSNAIPTLGTLRCDVRLLPGQGRADLEQVIARLTRDLAGLDVTIEATIDPSVSPFDEAVRGLFTHAAERALGRPARVVPTWCIGATDARYVRELGTPVYGFQLIHPDADADRLGIHCLDESIEVGMLLPCALSLAHLAVDFLEKTGEG
ncbi:MAG: M20/M25/M40 family metallo-hydrolase [bacterium]|nr:M20/M25/M40 family metallo-hydrolase [bacterium]